MPLIQFRVNRQNYVEGGASSYGTLYSECATVTGDDAVRDGQSKPGAFAGWLCCERLLQNVDTALLHWHRETASERKNSETARCLGSWSC